MESQVDASWTACTLCRSGRQSLSTLKQATLRKIEWPDNNHEPPDYNEHCSRTSVDDAFSAVLQLMSTSTRQCKRYYEGQPGNQKSPDDKHHCSRFHQKQPVSKKIRNPLSRNEDINVDIAPGTYAITAGRWGAERDHTQVIHVNPGQTIDLTFMV